MSDWQPPPNPSGPSPVAGLPRAALVVGAIVGLVVGAVGFVALAPADSATAGGSGGSGVTVTTSDGAGGTEGEAAAAGQAATPEEQAVYDLAAAFTAQDCNAIAELTEVSFWFDLFREVTGDVPDIDDDAQGISRCEEGFGSGELGEVRVFQTWILETVDQGGGGVRVAVEARGWGVLNTFLVRQEEGTWLVFSAAYDTDVVERGAAEVDRPEARSAGDPTDPPTGDATFDELAQNCFGGSMVACDDLYWVAPRASDHELYGITCGGRRGGVFAGGHCERDFNRQLDDASDEETSAP